MQPADRLGGLGRVLGDVARARRGLLGRAARVELAHLDLRAPADLARRRGASPAVRPSCRGRGRATRDVPRGRERGVDQQLRVVARARGASSSPSSSTPSRRSDAVEVQRAAALELGDLDVGHAHRAARFWLTPSRRASSRGSWIARPPPQLGRERVPQHRVLVVEALARRSARRGAGRPRRGPRRRRARRRAGTTSPSRRGRQRRALPSTTRRECTGPKLGAVSVRNTSGCSATVSGTPLPPRIPLGHELERVAAVGPRARRADGLAPVAAALQQRPVGLVVGRVGGHDLARRRDRSSRPAHAAEPAGGSSPSSAAGARSAPTRPGRRRARARPSSTGPAASRPRSCAHALREPLVRPTRRGPLGDRRHVVVVEVVAAHPDRPLALGEQVARRRAARPGSSDASAPADAQPCPRIVSEACGVVHRIASRNPNRSRSADGTTSAPGFCVAAHTITPAARPRATRSRSSSANSCC